MLLFTAMITPNATNNPQCCSGLYPRRKITTAVFRCMLGYISWQRRHIRHPVQGLVSILIITPVMAQPFQWFYNEGTSPIKNVEPPIKTKVSKKVYFLPIKSPNLPKTNAPKGRTKKPCSKNGQCTQQCSSIISFGKKLRGDCFGKHTKNVKIVPLN